MFCWLNSICPQQEVYSHLHCLGALEMQYSLCLFMHSGLATAWVATWRWTNIYFEFWGLWSQLRTAAGNPSFCFNVSYCICWYCNNILFCMFKDFSPQSPGPEHGGVFRSEGITSTWWKRIAYNSYCDLRDKAILVVFSLERTIKIQARGT